MSIVALGVGAAGVVTGAIVGGVALAKISGIQADVAKLEASCTTIACAQSAQGLVPEFDSARQLAYAAAVSFGVGGAGLLVGVVALIVDSANGGSSPRTARASSLAPWIGPGSAGVRGTF